VYRKATQEKFREKVLSRAVIDCSLLHRNYTNLYIRDQEQQIGAKSFPGACWNSPDIWVTPTLDIPSYEYWHPDIDNLQINVRVHNSSSYPYQDVIVRAFLADRQATAYWYPEEWKMENLIGETKINVPGNGSTVATIDWKPSHPLDTPWHPCILAEVFPMQVEPTHRHRVWENPKIAMKNIQIVEPSLDDLIVIIPFNMRHSYREGDDYALLTLSRLADLPGLKLGLEAGQLSLTETKDQKHFPRVEYLDITKEPETVISQRIRKLAMEPEKMKMGKEAEKTIPTVAYKVPLQEESSTDMKLRIDLSDTPKEARGGFIRLIQSKPDGTVVGGIDYLIRP
jgi:hypothetical protein